MSVTQAERDTTTTDRLLAGAARTIEAVRYCWLLTGAEGGLVNGRPMGRLLHGPDEDEWIIRFVVDGRSRKAAEVDREGEVAVIFQDDANDGYALLKGTATARREPAEIRRLWRPAFEAYFPTAEDRASAMFIEVRVDCMELWIRGVTPEPFGVRATRLERDAASQWRLACES
jgi:general stress protein 26